MSDLPTIYLSNWASRATPGHHGPGQKWTIMARPRHWECGGGVINELLPHIDDLDDLRSGTMTLAAYRANYLRWCLVWWRTTRRRRVAGSLAPGYLEACISPPGTLGGLKEAVVCGGDTLCCACSRAAAAKGECHRVWAAELLRDAGWRVILDGEELTA